MMEFGVIGIDLGGLDGIGICVIGNSEASARAINVKLGLETFPATLMNFTLPFLVIPV